MNSHHHMKTDLDHLPLRKRCELARMVDILLEEFPEKISTANGERRVRAAALSA